MSKVQNNTQSIDYKDIGFQGSNSLSFDCLIAKYFQSSDKAVILQDLKHFNKSKIKHDKLRHGLPLVYYSAKNKTENKFLYLHERTVSRYLKQLTNDGILFSTVCNKAGYDKTKSYLVNFAKYDAIAEGKEYSIAEGEKFIQLCNHAIKNNPIDRKALVIDIGQNGESNRQNGESNRQDGESNRQNGESNRQDGESNRQDGEPLPNNTTNNTPDNTPDINLENQKSSISTFKDIFKKNNIEFTPKTSDEVFLKIYHNIEAKIKAYKDENKINSVLTPQNVFDALILILSIIKQRINDESKYNLNYFSKAIKDEPKETFFGKKQNEKQSWAQQNGKILDRNNYRLAKEQGGNVFVVHEKPTFAERSGKIISSEHFRIAAEQIGNSKVFVGHEKQSWAENKNGKTEKSKNTVLETVKTGSAKNTVFESFSDEQKIDKIRKELMFFTIPFRDTQSAENTMLEIFNFLQKHNPETSTLDIFEKFTRSFHSLVKKEPKSKNLWNLESLSNYILNNLIN
jgi:hypothetical protein